MRSKVTLLNVISGGLLQVCAIISGMIIPRIILEEFGSEVNGLVNSLLQFLTYISLIEGGITGVVSANLYKPIVSGNYQKMSSILVTARRFFVRIGMIYIGYSIVIGIIYPLAMGMRMGYVFALTLILSLTTLLQYLFSLTYQILLNSDKKGYIVNSVQILVYVLSVLLVYISVKVYPSIHFVKLISGLLFALQPLILGIYVRRNYPLDWKAPSDDSLIKERWNGAAINLAAFIHGSVDVTVLTIFADLKTVSVYTVYALVTTGIKRMIGALTAGLNPIIGLAYAKGDTQELNKKMDLYEFITIVIVCFSFSMAGLLITPFVMLYTNGIHDASYSQPLFGYILVLSEALYLIKLPHLNFAYTANKFREITGAAYIESILNIVLSVILVRTFGLTGIAVGTAIAMFYRMVYHVYFTGKEIKGREPWIFYRKLLIYVTASLISMGLCLQLFPMGALDFWQWIIHAVGYSIVFATLFFIVGGLFFKDEMRFLANYIGKRKE
ncbi:Membrane protein involved in the export of O-antigen and teichoic acid [[Clostridium] aminophilum]|uniref:Membrane protein involved in the export of O-antigen and teichoic acid n=1 Tax=[Clostridium] aminophilum TaxID=1526 RepID=A0A1I6K6H1_9FIRM|nr:polysaccharide biosynthesis C-terminal domain-containing protein [[Clostridium] aminophilum]SFR86744.1 Membrane protein involved in the export of O-antigen and teichoic acid [[Clostridium] aminophilum]